MEQLSNLTTETRGEVEALLDICNRHEALDIPIFLDFLVTDGDARTALLQRGDDGALIGFAAVPDDSAPEACLMVHPDYRRRGFGRSLLTAMRAELQRRGLAECLLVTDAASPSAHPFLGALNIPYRFSEFRLQLDPAAIDRSRPRHDALRLRPAAASDSEALVTVLAGAFADPDKEVRRGAVAAGLQERTRRFYLAELEGEPIGVLRAGEWGGNGDITAFGVLPAHQRRGYGRQILLDAVDLLLAEGWPQIFIEVATDNPGALGLYESCGFRVTNEFGYYGVVVG